MPKFSELEESAPDVARFFRDRVTRTGIAFVGTTRSDGWPRISPMEITLSDGRIFAGSMPNAVKAKDLQRDGRCCLITTLIDKDDLEGEAKLFCRAREVTDPEDWSTLRAMWLESPGIDIGEPGQSHIFEFDVEAAAHQWVEDGENWRTTSWRAGRPLRERIRTGALGESREL